MPKDAALCDNLPFAEPALKFITFQRPTDAKSAKARKAVRSHVTRLQHCHSRQRFARQYNQSLHALITPDPFRAVKRPEAYAYQQRRSAEDKSKDKDVRSTAVQDVHTRNVLAPPLPPAIQGKNKAVIEQSPPPDEDDEEMVVVKQKPVVPRTFEIPSSILGKAFGTGAMAFRTFVLDDSENIVGTTLKRLRFNVSSVLGFYDYMVSIQSRDFDRYYKPPSGSSHTRFLEFMMADPVLLTAAILLSCQFLLANRSSSTASADFVHVLKLRGFLINVVNTALDDPVRAVSDQMLVTITLLSAHELKYGSLEGYHVHMRGLVQMINLRGGLPEIGREDPYLERFILWHDANTTNLAGCESYCQKIERPSRLHRPRGNKAVFSMEGAIK